VSFALYFGDVTRKFADLARNPVTATLISTGTTSIIGLVWGTARRARKGDWQVRDLIIAPTLFVIVVACTVYCYKVNDGGSTTTVTTPAQAAQIQDLDKRVKADGLFAKCDPVAPPVAHADATISCQAYQSGITVTSSSFYAPSNIPYNWFEVSSESPDLNSFLTSNSPSLAIVPVWNQSSGLPGQFCYMHTEPVLCDSVALAPGFSGYWTFQGNESFFGRLYCYSKGGIYYIAWTVDNDEYEGNLGEDIVVIASGRNLASLASWWSKDPV
jgi:hypothetical protein